MNPVYIEVKAGVRYWEDAEVNGTADESGNLIPHRSGNYWTPVIRLADGHIMEWPEGTTADVHYKVCDDGEYWLLDENRQRIGKWSGFYVPNSFLCHGDTGYGDYIIFKVDGAGNIEKWSVPDVVWSNQSDEEGEDDRGWLKLESEASPSTHDKAVSDVLAERQRQITVKGWTPEHDDEHVNHEISAMACYYAMPPAARDWDATSTTYGHTLGAAILPEDWTPPAAQSRRRELVKAGALILAEIERMDRSAAKGGAK